MAVDEGEAQLKVAELISKAKSARRKTLDLTGLSLPDLPPEIGQLTTLTELSLSNNKLTSLPTEIGQLTALT